MASVKKDAAIEAKKVAVKAAAEPEDERVMYVGPTITNPPLIQNTVYSSIPQAAQDAFAAHPQLKILFIPMNRLAELKPIFDKQMREKKGAYYVAYQAVQGL